MWLRKTNKIRMINETIIHELIMENECVKDYNTEYCIFPYVVSNPSLCGERIMEYEVNML